MSISYSIYCASFKNLFCDLAVVIPRWQQGDGNLSSSVCYRRAGARVAWRRPARGLGSQPITLRLGNEVSTDVRDAPLLNSFRSPASLPACPPNHISSATITIMPIGHCVYLLRGQLVVSTGRLRHLARLYHFNYTVCIVYNSSSEKGVSSTLRQNTRDDSHFWGTSKPSGLNVKIYYQSLRNKNKPDENLSESYYLKVSGGSNCREELSGVLWGLATDCVWRWFSVYRGRGRGRERTGPVATIRRGRHTRVPEGWRGTQELAVFSRPSPKRQKARRDTYLHLETFVLLPHKKNLWTIKRCVTVCIVLLR